MDAPDTPKSIKIGPGDAGRERRRRQRELLLAALAILAVVILTWIELRYLQVNSYLFLALFNLNFILLLLILFIVGRNAVKLLLERRRNVLGAKLRTKLVLAFISLSLVPTALMFLVSLKFVETSMDYWFKSQVENSMKLALGLGQDFYAQSQERLGRRAEALVRSIVASGYVWGGRTMDEYLEQKRQEYDLFLLGVIAPDRHEQNWHIAGGFEPFWSEARDKVNWAGLTEQPEFWSTILPGKAGDLVVGILPVDGGRSGYLALGEDVGQGIMFKLDQIVRGVEEYKKLKALRHPLRMTLYFILAVITLLIVLGAMWFGFRMAKELSSPIQALAEGTERIARGDLSVRLEDPSRDELGLLVASFNRMAEDLEQSRSSLTEANIRLGKQNLELESRGRYIEAVLENIAAGVISLDGLGRVNTVNKAAAELLGIQGVDVRGMRALELLRGEHADLLGAVARHLRDTPESLWQRQLDITVGDQSRKLLVNVVALSPRNGIEAGLVAVFEDITELEKMQRMAAWREVARRIAHEIKNPLTPIKLSAQRMERKFGPAIPDPAFSQCTGLIVRQVEHLQQLVREFSAFAKLPEVELRPDNPVSLLEEVFALFETSHHQIIWTLEMDALPDMAMDREALRRALVNVLTNAVEALENRQDGRVVVSAVHEKRQGMVRVTIRDNGPGLTPEERSRLFEPYFSRKKGGTGLGLAIVKSIITDHKGYVRASSVLGGGTAVVVDLPVA